MRCRPRANRIIELANDANVFASAPSPGSGSVLPAVLCLKYNLRYALIRSLCAQTQPNLLFFLGFLAGSCTKNHQKTLKTKYFSNRRRGADRALPRNASIPPGGRSNTVRRAGAMCSFSVLPKWGDRGCRGYRIFAPNAPARGRSTCPACAALYTGARAPRPGRGGGGRQSRRGTPGTPPILARLARFPKNLATKFPSVHRVVAKFAKFSKF